MFEMSLEKFLHFLMGHNATIIEVLLGLTLLVILFLSIRMFLIAKETDVSSGSIDLSNLENTLKQLLEKAGQVPATAGAGSSEESQKLVSEISNLKVELQSKQKQIEDLKTQTPAEAPAASGFSAEDRSQLESQLAELQAKLSEYEIISEDIADLSFYKEQNVKLQKELDALKSAGPAVAVASPQPVAAAPAPVIESAPPSASAIEKEEPAIVGRSQTSAEAGTEAPTAEVSNAIDDDLMAEFAAAVEKQKGGGAAAENAPSAAVEAAPAGTEETVDLGQLDMDKMMAEAATIKSDVPDVAPEDALGTSLDENKLLQEAAALQGVSPEDKRLMGEFENFVKKEK